MKSLYANLERWRPYVLSILRIVVALLFLQHGLSKSLSENIMRDCIVFAT